jgi:hypothetical protein
MVLFYSEGDTVQIADCISTKGKSCRTFSELVSLEQARNRIHEILVKCGGDSTVLRHRAYFIFDAYHENLSALYRIVLGKNEAIDFLNPLPFVILSPIVMNLLQSVPPRKKHATQCELDVQVGPCSCNLQLMVLNQCQRCSPNVWQAISDIKKRVAATWAPYAKTSDVKKIFWLGQHLITRS